MSAWDEPAVKIGRSVGGGGGPRPVTLKSRADINAAARAGNVDSSKKIGAVNATNPNWQQKYKIDNSDSVKIGEKKVPHRQLEENLTALMQAVGSNKAALARSVSVTPDKLWTPSAANAPDYKAIGRLESMYQWKVNGQWGPMREPKADKPQLVEFHQKLNAATPKEVQKGSLKIRSLK